MARDLPTRRPTDANEAASDDRPDASLSRPDDPWIDAHNHAHTLSWDDRERYARSGCAAMVTVAGGYHWTPYRPVAAEDVRYLWDQAIARRGPIERAHGFEVGLAVGAHTGVRIDDPGPLVSAMDGYCALPEVVAVGETGITPSQHASRWPLDGQREVVRDQMALAADHGLPVLLHTPADPDEAALARPDRDGSAGYERDPGLRTAPVIDSDAAPLEAVEIDVELADDVGLDHDRIVASHAGPWNVDYLLEETGCFVSFTVGYPWLTGVTAADVAGAIERYGAERVMLETDAANVLRSDVRSVERTMRQLARLGVEAGDIRRVAYENPAAVFGFEA